MNIKNITTNANKVRKMPYSLQHNMHRNAMALSPPFGSVASPIAAFSLFYSSAASLSCLWYFWYFLPIIHFITSPPFLSAVFHHACYHFWGRMRRRGGIKQRQSERQSTASTTNQHYFVCIGQAKLSCYKLACGSWPAVHCISQMPSM